MTTTQLAARRNLEQYLAKKAEGMLEKVLGSGQALVRVAAEINYDTVSRTEEKFDPDGQVVRTQTKTEDDNDTTSATAAVPAGIGGNIPEPTNSVATASPVTTTRNKKSVGTTEYEINKSTSNIMQFAGGIKRLSVAVTVAARYEGTGASRKMVARSSEELEKLRRVVQSALGIDQGNASERNDQITLEELTFNDQLPGDMAEKLDRQERNEFWMNLGKSALYPLFAMVFLGLLLWQLKRTSLDEIPIGIPIDQINIAQPTNGNGSVNGNGHGKSFSLIKDTIPGVVTVEVLNQLIKENPDNMTQAIRSWMTREKPEQN